VPRRCEVRCVRGGRACDVCATARSSQQLQGHDPNGTGPRSGSAVLCGPIWLSGLCVYEIRQGRHLCLPVSICGAFVRF
jgi:hypothetical protein